MSITFQQLVNSLAINSEFTVDIYEYLVFLGFQSKLDAVVVKPLDQETSEVFGVEEVSNWCLLTC